MFYKNIQFKEDSNYVFEASRVNALRLNLFSLNDYERMLDNDMDYIFSSLNEKNYDISDKNFELVTKKAEEKLLKLLMEFSKNEDFVEYFRLPYDFFNLKTMYKGWLKEEGFENLKLVSFGLLSSEKLKKFYEGEEVGVIHPALAKSLKDFENDIVEQTPFEIDVLWDKYLHRFFVFQAKKIGSDFLTKIHSLKIDILNVNNLLRFKSFDKDYKAYKHIFIEGGGQLSLYDLSDLYKEEPEIIIGKMNYLDYYEALKKGLDEFKKAENLSGLEIELEKFFASYVAQAGNKIFGFEILFAYFWLKMNEIANIRLLLTAKENNIQKDWILKRLRG